MRQEAPDPAVLAELVRQTTYKPGWTFSLQDLDRGQGSRGLTLVISVATVDTNDVNRKTRVAHYMVVPAASYNAQSWRRWLFEQVCLVERHEAAEFFRIDGQQPYAPNHGGGNDPYMLFELTTQAERGKTFRE